MGNIPAIQVGSQITSTMMPEASDSGPAQGRADLPQTDRCIEEDIQTDLFDHLTVVVTSP